MTIAPADLNRPDVLAEVMALFQSYEAALMRNDAEALDAFFWAHPAVTRYGIADRQWGHGELAAFRRSVPPLAFTRRLEAVRVTALGEDTAVVMCEFVRSDTPLRGFQTQTWARLPEGWRIVAAHVSMIPWPT